MLTKLSRLDEMHYSFQFECVQLTHSLSGSNLGIGIATKFFIIQSILRIAEENEDYAESFKNHFYLLNLYDRAEHLKI